MTRAMVLVVLVVLGAGCAQAGPVCEPFLGSAEEYPRCPGSQWAICVESSTGAPASCDGDPDDAMVRCSDDTRRCVGSPSLDVRCHGGEAYCGVPGYEPACVSVCGIVDG